MITMDAVCHCESQEDVDLMIKYGAFKGHTIENGELVVDGLTVTMKNAKAMDSVYVDERMADPREPA